MRNIRKKLFQSTFMKYFLSYAIILLTIIAGIYFIIDSQLKKEYLSLYRQDSKTQIIYTGNRISDNLSEFEKTALSLSSDVTIINAKYSNDDYSRYLIITELNKYRSRSSLSRDVIYFDWKTDTAYSTVCQYDASRPSIDILSGNGGEQISLPESYYRSDETFGKLFAVSDGASPALFYSPKTVSTNYRIVYMLDLTELQTIMESCLSKGISGARLVDAFGNILFSAGAEFPTDNIGTDDLITLNLAYSDTRLEALFDQAFLSSSTDAAFYNARWMLAALLVLGIILVFFSMKQTYLPLHNLQKRITSKHDYFSNDIALIDNMYLVANELNDLLQKRVDSYRSVIQKSFTCSEIFSDHATDTVLDHIEELLSSGESLMFAVVKISFTESVSKDRTAKLLDCFPGETTVLLLENDTERQTFVFLVVWKDELDADLSSLLHPLELLVDTCPCMATFSDYSANPLDIARLYSNASEAERFLSPACRLMGYNDVPETIDHYEGTYSYDLVDRLAQTLEELDLEKSRSILEELISTLDSQQNPEIFVRCILIDVTTLISTSMSRNAVEYSSYNTLLADTLDMCRKKDCSQAKEEILQNLNAMLDILFEASSAVNTSRVQIEMEVKNNYCQPDFSITALADHFHVSVAYMSFLFKKKFNVNFVNYVWKLRYERAQTLLSTTDYSVDKVGKLVGYENASSFRRKFKEECGISPSEYRRQQKESVDS